MNADILVNRYRTFLLLVAGISCVFTIVELWLEEHTGDPPQLIPFVLCGIGAVAIAAVLFRPRRMTLKLLRIVMGVMLFGSLFGLFEHVEHNLEFAKEIRPNASFSVLLSDTLYGANPLLAPGILALAAVLAIAATYFHPVLQAPDKSN